MAQPASYRYTPEEYLRLEENSTDKHEFIEGGIYLMVKPVLDELMSKAGFWVSPAFYADILQLAGETAL
ncbi:DUF3368 domain-containing protein [Candidatus Chlorohelix sp.]|uniref:DUF3368 domain-containing protein n=1 Tax=Candidatus Chlorohelix sp. TaxID=3139201 RepID=UPI00302CEAB1